MIRPTDPIPRRVRSSRRLLRATCGAAFVLCLSSLVTTHATAQETKEQQAPSGSLVGSRAVTYKTVGDVKLDLHVFAPQGHAATDKRPAIVFFFGGGWTGGTPTQFAPQSRRLAQRGMVAIVADYRVKGRHGTPAVKCVQDAKSAVRYIRAHAAELGVDPTKIVAAGGSAGGHIAACTGTITGHEEPGEDAKVSSVPNALALFNPAVVLADVPDKYALPADRAANLKERCGVEPREISPYHHVRAGQPPTIVLHGQADSTVPYKSVELFAEAMTKAGNRCTLVGYEGAQHGFFNRGPAYEETLAALDAFLVDLGYLPPAKKPAAGK